MIDVIPLNSRSAMWTVDQFKIPRSMTSLVEFAVKLSINSVAQFKRSEITVNIHSATLKYIHFLNKKYRNQDKPTNVLSFASDALLDEFDLDDVPRELGDIFICFDVVQEESILYKKQFLDHLFHMLVHGSLHLMGYDHENLEDEKKMQNKEILILQAAGIENPYLVEDKVSEGQDTEA